MCPLFVQVFKPRLYDETIIVFHTYNHHTNAVTGRKKICHCVPFHPPIRHVVSDVGSAICPFDSQSPVDCRLRFAGTQSSSSHLEFSQISKHTSLPYFLLWSPQINCTTDITFYYRNTLQSWQPPCSSNQSVKTQLLHLLHIST